MTDEPQTLGEILDALPEPKPEGRDMNAPRVGFWLVRPVSRGSFIPACIKEITTERSVFLQGFLNGNPTTVWDIWHRKGVEISEQEYDLALLDSLAGIEIKGTWKDVKEANNG